MQGLKYRHELKHVVTMADAVVISSRLSGLLESDRHAGPDGKYQIRSLYFDTLEDKALYEKINGLPLREKFRIRYYNHDLSFIRLEKKIKHYGMTAKLGETLTETQTRQILAGDYDFLKDSDQPLLREFFLGLHLERLVPRTVVDYWREAFFHPAGNVRITIDSGIRGAIGYSHFLDADLPNADAMDDGYCILEVKFDEFLPEFIQDAVQLNTCSPTAVSKYAACRVYV